MQTSHGVITLVQEHRFRLFGDDGSHRLFVLAHGAPLGWHELDCLQRAGSPVRVRHEPAPGLVAAVAHDVVASASEIVRPEQARGTS